MTSWRQKVAEPQLVSTGGRNQIIWGSPLALEEEIQSFTERKIKTSLSITRIRGGRTRNMRIPTVNTSQCNIVIVSLDNSAFIFLIFQ